MFLILIIECMYASIFVCNLLHISSFSLFSLFSPTSLSNASFSSSVSSLLYSSPSSSFFYSVYSSSPDSIIVSIKISYGLFLLLRVVLVPSPNFPTTNRLCPQSNKSFILSFVKEAKLSMLVGS